MPFTMSIVCPNMKGTPVAQSMERLTSVVIDILLLSTAYNRIGQRLPRLLLEWVTVLVCQLLDETVQSRSLAYVKAHELNLKTVIIESEFHSCNTEMRVIITY